MQFSLLGVKMVVGIQLLSASANKKELTQRQTSKIAKEHHEEPLKQATRQPKLSIQGNSI